MSTELHQRVRQNVTDLMPILEETSRYLYEHPEEGHCETQSCAWLVNTLQVQGFSIDTPYCDLETAFLARYASGQPGARIGLLCEYDALPVIGHGCGHNLISSMGLGAALALRPLMDEFGGELLVFGTPAEETSGAKVAMAELGVFDDLDAVMMAHPAPTYEESGGSLAMSALQFDFHGQEAHAAKSPEAGRNALDAAMLFFQGVNAMRQHVTDDVRVHGIIAHGGEAANVVPAQASVQFYVRAGRRATRDAVMERTLRIAQGACLMTDTTMDWQHFEVSYEDLVSNPLLCARFSEHLRTLGVCQIQPAAMSMSSLDVGNVSYRVPTIHPWIGLGDPGLSLHTREFADRTQTDAGRQALFNGACAMAMTAVDLLADPAFVSDVRAAFDRGASPTTA